MVHGQLSILIGIISVVSLWLSYKVMMRLTGGVKIPVISTFFMLNYIAYAFIGSVTLNIFFLEYEINTNIYDRKDLLFNTWIYALLGLYLIPIGMLIVNVAFYRYKPKENAVQFLSRDIIITNKDRSNLMFFVLVFLFSIGLGTFALYSSKVELPLLAVFKGLSKGDLAFLRSESGAAVSKMYRYVMFMKSLPMLLLIIVFFLKNQGTKWKVFFYVLLIYNIVVSLGGLQKSPILKLIILLSLATFYLNKKINKKLLFRLFIIIVVLMMVMYMFFMGLADRDFTTILYAPFNRIFLGQIRPFHYYQLFQEEFGYIYGTSFPNPGGIFPFTWRRITVEIMTFAHPELVKMGIVGSMPTVFWGEWYINFGPWAVCFSMILFGAIIQFFDMFFISVLARYKSVFLSVLFVYFIAFFSKYSQTSFTGLIIDTELLFPLFVVLLIVLIKQLYIKLQMKINKNKV